MNPAYAVPAPGAPGLPAALRACAPSIAHEAIARLRPADRTVAAKIVATRLVDRFAASVAVGDWKLLTVWVNRACERYTGIVPAPEIMAAAMDGIVAMLGTQETISPAALAAVRSDVEQIIARPRLLKGLARHEAVDEIDVVLDGLLIELDQSDVLTAEHSRAVSSWCARLGRRLGLPKAEILHLTRAGLIHDIGKVTTPAAILSAPRRLSEDEMAIMRMHAEEGAKIVARIPLIANLMPAVRNHHERFDGSGYPDRLLGEAIPPSARIVAVADAFNAMIGRRPYRPPLAPSVALERLVESRGDHFDPDVVDAMVDVVTRPDR